MATSSGHRRRAVAILGVPLFGRGVLPAQYCPCGLTDDSEEDDDDDIVNAVDTLLHILSAGSRQSELCKCMLVRCCISAA